MPQVFAASSGAWSHWKLQDPQFNTSKRRKLPNIHSGGPRYGRNRPRTSNSWPIGLSSKSAANSNCTTGLSPGPKMVMAGVGPTFVKRCMYHPSPHLLEGYHSLFTPALGLKDRRAPLHQGYPFAPTPHNTDLRFAHRQSLPSG